MAAHTYLQVSNRASVARKFCMTEMFGGRRVPHLFGTPQQKWTRSYRILHYFIGSWPYENKGSCEKSGDVETNENVQREAGQASFLRH